MKSSWDPEEWDVKIWSESSDSKIEFEPDLVDKEVSRSMTAHTSGGAEECARRRGIGHMHLCQK